jgi:hypothetical protein
LPQARLKQSASQYSEFIIIFHMLLSMSRFENMG